MTAPAPAPESPLAPLIAKHTPPLTPGDIRTLTDPLTDPEKDRLRDVIAIDAILATPYRSQSGRLLRCVFGTLRALGYDTPWLSAVTGLTAAQMAPTANRRVPLTHMQLALTVAARIGDRPATPEVTGLTQTQIDAVRLQARRDHFFPPACYTEMYVYVSGSALNLERFRTEAPTATAGKIRAAAQFMREGGTAASLAAQHGFASRTWHRIVEDLGIQTIRTGGGNRVVVTPAPGQDALREAITEAAAALDMGADALDVWAMLRVDTEALTAERAAAQAAEEATETTRDEQGVAA